MNSGSLFQELRAQFAAQLPFVAYRKPHETFLKAILQKNDEINLLEDFSEKGFIISPFETSKNAYIFPESDCSFFKADVEKINVQDFPNYYENEFVLREENLKYIEKIKEALKTIENGALEKVVLSRSESIKLENIDIFEIFSRLLSRHEEAFVYIWYHPKVGLWMGASPERLIRIKNNQFETVALAGTKSALEIPWQKKEYREQQLVTDFLNSSLQDLSQEIKISTTETIKTGELFHLKTTLSGVLKNPKNDLPKLIDRLHPTPAVCGTPRETAKAFIRNREEYDREFYTGYLGELNLSNNHRFRNNKRNIENQAFFDSTKMVDLYVNLRCMQIIGKNAIIYIGGGITSDSIPMMEWEETVRKSRTVKKVLQ